MTGIPFLRGFSLEQRDKLLNNSVSRSSVVLEGIQPKASKVPVVKCGSKKESDQRIAQFSRKNLIPNRSQTKGLCNSNRHSSSWNGPVPKGGQTKGQHSSNAQFQQGESGSEKELDQRPNEYSQIKKHKYKTQDLETDPE